MKVVEVLNLLPLMTGKAAIYVLHTIMSMILCQDFDVYEGQDLQWADVLGESSPG
jgi:hypothetical protein